MSKKSILTSIINKYQEDKNFYQEEAENYKNEFNKLKREYKNYQMKMDIEKENIVKKYNEVKIDLNKKIEQNFVLENWLKEKNLEIEEKYTLIYDLNKQINEITLKFNNNLDCRDSINSSKIFLFNDEVKKIKFNFKEIERNLKHITNIEKNKFDKMILSKNKEILIFKNKLNNINKTYEGNLNKIINQINNNFLNEIKKLEEQIFYLYKTKSDLKEDNINLNNKIFELKKFSLNNQISQEYIENLKDTISQKNNVIDINKEIILKFKTKIEDLSLELNSIKFFKKN